jgi:hypothetical protein
MNIDNMVEVAGRSVEIGLLQKIAQSGEAELVAVYGRRRVGKTYLIKSVFREEMAFEISGLHNATFEQQMENFQSAFEKATRRKAGVPGTWIQAFKMLTRYLTPLLKKQRRVIFIDEFPWISSPRSGFMPAFENFWNTWASLQPNLIVVICGSSASWMIKKVLNSRGGLHNRVTRRIRLLPFTLDETEEFFRVRKVNLDRYQLLQLYMVMGGIPQYLKEVERGESAIQAIDRTCFTKDGLLHDEFRNLFHSLFDDAGDHVAVIRALAKKGVGLTRAEIIDTCKLTSGGGVTQILDELAQSGFIKPYAPFGKAVKDSVYKLTDEYSLFYIRFIENGRFSGAGSWERFAAGAAWRSWSGVAFESICMKHIVQMKRALGIEQVHTETSMWRSRPGESDPGTQIDLLIDRRDQCINICEMKFSVNSFELSKAYAKELQNKVRIFRENVKTRKTLFLTLVTTHGVRNKDSYPGLVQSEVTMDALFKKLS